jgi:hypothetical protein
VPRWNSGRHFFCISASPATSSVGHRIGKIIAWHVTVNGALWLVHILLRYDNTLYCPSNVTKNQFDLFLLLCREIAASSFMSFMSLTNNTLFSVVTSNGSWHSLYYTPSFLFLDYQNVPPKRKPKHQMAALLLKWFIIQIPGPRFGLAVPSCISTATR